ncbi:MAG: hypothetical protein WBX10_18180, partial [Candidatus Sulfotelmatobacter sp.]
MAEALAGSGDCCTERRVNKTATAVSFENWFSSETTVSTAKNDPATFWPVIGEIMHDHLHDTPKPQLLQIAPLPPQKPHDHHTEFMVGLDVGSTTVKATVVDAATDKVLWQDYQRHETKQPEK